MAVSLGFTLLTTGETWPLHLPVEIYQSLEGLMGKHKHPVELIIRILLKHLEISWEHLNISGHDTIESKFLLNYSAKGRHNGGLKMCISSSVNL